MICNVTACTENYKAHLRSIDHYGNIAIVWTWNFKM